MPRKVPPRSGRVRPEKREAVHKIRRRQDLRRDALAELHGGVLPEGGPGARVVGQEQVAALGEADPGLLEQAVRILVEVVRVLRHAAAEDARPLSAHAAGGDGGHRLAHPQGVQHQHAGGEASGGEAMGDGEAGDAGADHHDVVALHGAPPPWRDQGAISQSSSCQSHSRSTPCSVTRTFSSLITA